MTTPHTDDQLEPCPLCGSTDLFLRDIAGWELDCRGCELSLVLADDPSREGLIRRWNTRACFSAGGVVPTVNRLFETKLLGFAEDDRIRLCEPCVRRATEANLVIFACALPLGAATTAAPVKRSEPNSAFDAALEVLEFLNFDTGLPEVREDASQIATIISSRRVANEVEEGVEGE